jgi:hypothetical protein
MTDRDGMTGQAEKSSIRARVKESYGTIRHSVIRVTGAGPEHGRRRRDAARLKSSALSPRITVNPVAPAGCARWDAEASTLVAAPGEGRRRRAGNYNDRPLTGPRGIQLFTRAANGAHSWLA